MESKHNFSSFIHFKSRQKQQIWSHFQTTSCDFWGKEFTTHSVWKVSKFIKIPFNYLHCRVTATCNHSGDFCSYALWFEDCKIFFQPKESLEKLSITSFSLGIKTWQKKDVLFCWSTVFKYRYYRQACYFPVMVIMVLHI